MASETLKIFLEALNFGERSQGERRDQLWKQWDQNANGWLSLAEVDDAIKNILDTHLRKAKDADAKGSSEAIWRRYRPSYIRAFNNAKDAHAGSDKREDDYVSKEEFRLLICYLRYYATWFEVFMMVDTSSDGKAESDADYSDRRIDPNEWRKGHAKVVAAGKSWAPFLAFQKANADSFAKIDLDQGQYITIKEFCAWAEAAEKKAGTAVGKDLAVGDDRVRKDGSSFSSFCSVM